MKIALVVGARPNFVKAAPVYHALRNAGLHPLLIHTGQHSDHRMSDGFFSALGLSTPDLTLSMPSSDNRAQQFGAIVCQLGHHLPALQPDRVLVFGDVTSTAAAAVAADACNIPVDHVEAGLRSHDRTMPEERNRLLVDSIAQHLFVTESSALTHLHHEGHADTRIHLVGNTMIDALQEYRQNAEAMAPWRTYDLHPYHYGVVTLHRPSNVDNADYFLKTMRIVRNVAQDLPLLFAVHPRTQQRIARYPNLIPRNIIVTPPLDYLAFLGLMARAQLILTDSGGMQEEASMLDVPCLVLRENTERPVTLTTSHGTCTLVGWDEALAMRCVAAVRNDSYPSAPQRPPLWDGHAAERIVNVLTTLQ